MVSYIISLLPSAPWSLTDIWRNILSLVSSSFFIFIEILLSSIFFIFFLFFSIFILCHQGGPGWPGPGAWKAPALAPTLAPTWKALKAPKAQAPGQVPRLPDNIWQLSGHGWTIWVWKMLFLNLKTCWNIDEHCNMMYHVYKNLGKPRKFANIFGSIRDLLMDPFIPLLCTVVHVIVWMHVWWSYS